MAYDLATCSATRTLSYLWLNRGGGVLAVLHPNGIGVTQERGVLSVGHNQQTFLFNLQKADIQYMNIYTTNKCIGLHLRLYHLKKSVIAFS